jgi:hypothetical protein
VRDLSRRQLDDLALRLDELRAGRSTSELADLVLLADGFTEVLLREVADARDRSDRDVTGSRDGPD